MGRSEHMLKHSFRLFFRSDYGSAKLKYPLFPNSSVQEFDTLILRATANDGLVVQLDPNRRMVSYIRDEWARESQIAMSGIGSRGLWVHLYLNGLYWGLYNLVERPDESFFSSYLGGSTEEWYVVSPGGTVSGQIDRFAALMRLAEEGGLADPARYATMLEFVDPEQFSDYLLLNWFIGSRDWPETNWYVGVRFPAGRNLFLAWDSEVSWDNDVGVYLGGDPLPGSPFPNVVKLVFDALAENPDFRSILADRAYKHLFNDGVLTDKAAKERWLNLMATVENPMIAESARWGDVRFDPAFTQDDWYGSVNYVLAQMDGNAAKLIDSMRTLGYYPPMDPPVLSQHGGIFTDTLSLSMALTIPVTKQTPTGEIYFTLDGSDPRDAASGLPSPSARIYTEPLGLTTSTVVKSRVLDGATWSALSVAPFQRADQKIDVRITELMYNPPGGDNFEFVEISNVGQVDCDLSLAYFEGIDFLFPRHTTLAAGETKVLIRDYTTYRSRYATTRFDGFYTGKLSNQGETITLRDSSGQILASVSYDDENGWPWSADGRGDSLTLHNLTLSANNPRSWSASDTLYGSPGDVPWQNRN